MIEAAQLFNNTAIQMPVTSNAAIALFLDTMPTVSRMVFVRNFFCGTKILVLGETLLKNVSAVKNTFRKGFNFTL